MGFMEPRIDEDDWFLVETKNGTQTVSADLVTFTINPGVILDKGPRFEMAKSLLSPYLDGSKVESIRKVHGFGAHLTAPGYMDRTDITVFEFDPKDAQAKEKAFNEAKSFLRDTYDEDVDMDEEGFDA